jgi:hypothetical protein
MNTQNQNPPQQKANPDFVFDKYVAIALVVGLIAGFIIGDSFGSKKSVPNNSLVFGDNATTSSSTMSDMSGMTSMNSGTTSGAMSTPTTVTSSDITVGDQKPGSYVTISKISLDKNYWVAIRDNSDTTKTPYVLGAQKVFAGTHNNVSVYVSRMLDAGKSYEVVLYNDSADFNFSPSNIVMNDSSIVRSTFSVK